MPYFVLYAPDYADEDAVNRRLAVRDAHLANGLKNPAAKIGGAMLSPNEALDTPDAPKKMAGSLVIYEANSYAEVKAMVEADVYWMGNVWDKEKTVIVPFVSPKPL
ncbi:hypothetical protein L226DRAFT_467496 [Lentinus tigrinus ALCF2SS1-7]|uniref:YCII-related domain-containing protein n=1 Tax=Lentinus tigrinus ALCF2SS1-6 TaxID=1328759 RepID=A0A5C2S7M2_9APHY|nr:hypothetical protein L227DRAFT_613661 [Lentinus tigrinus ALCF2SS1-6]RPD72006.1 hypothetical protein L226DRAFT_467496 [Lentinus tigrinus ALCF2SS1-7]